MIKAEIKSIQQFLEKQGMKCAYVPSSEQVPLDQLFVSLGSDEKKRDLLLQIKIVEADISEEQDLLKLPKPKHKPIFVQFFCALPFKTKGEYSGELARFILLLNKSFGIPGYEYSEVDGLVYFRSTLPVLEELDESILIILISNIMLNVDVFSPTIEQIGLGEISLVEVLKTV